MSKKIDPRVKRTRQLLRDALVELINEYGYEKITVQDITQRATLNRATFYLHYRDKLDLLYQSSEEILQELVASIRPTAEEQTNVALLQNGEQPHETFVQLFEKIAVNSTFYKVYLTEKNLPYFSEGLKKIIMDFVSSGIYLMAPDDQKLTVPRDMAIRFYAAAFLEVVVWWLENDMPYTPKFMATQLMRITMNGPYMANPFL
ncbi:TetR/AcrR family transcriptional regulator [Lysinibacillus piscis]|uniref:TetR family transcriptional regulator n=1 Tax=Lysinibacillus piscis TaxID=2518931 RepID=A0ABQ5NF18_9BACI|nr:TetR/AcrR family transcriptional regulator [Lysinibacillus sp. KH24]GLC86979.1 TetR family transcriptional regulator [Lysinibacillus sp. KH24]